MIKFQKIEFYLTSATGWLVVANFLVFIIISLSSFEIFSPRETALIAFGAKDPVGLALGQWWRLVTPVFLHIGIVHFFLNYLALDVIGRQLEPVLGKGWFLAIYILSGTFGNILSSFGNISIGAGASGAIFGLIGVGVVFEQCIKRVRGSFYEEGIVFPSGWRGWLRRLASQLGPYSMVAIINIALAVGLNFIFSLSDSISFGIDNFAHLGGLFAGIWLTITMLSLRKNSFFKRRLPLGALMLFIFLGGSGYSAFVLTKTNYISGLYQHEIAKEKSDVKNYYYLSQLLKINPADSGVRFQRGSLLLRYGELRNAYIDLQIAARDPLLIDRFMQLDQEMITLGRKTESVLIENMMKQMRELAH
jgi:rhomboid protease GluP